MAEGTTDNEVKQSEETVAEGSILDQLLDGPYRSFSEENKGHVSRAVTTLAQQAVSEANLISDDAFFTLQAMISEIDKRLSDQVNEILHHEEFQKVEGTWRGLHYLVSNSETDAMLKVQVLNINKKELHSELRSHKGAFWDQSAIFRKLYENEFGTAGGEPFGALIGDYYFDHGPQDIELLREMAKIGAAAHAPFISAAAPGLMGFESWQELPEPRDIAEKFTATEYAAWRSLRDSEDSRYVGLTMPRVLSRLPYGEKTEPVEEFAFEEETEAGDHSKYTWMNAAYAMGANINRAFKLYGWCSQIRGVESGGLVENLPLHTFPTSDGDVDAKCPTEVSITDRREHELAKNGLLSLVHHKNSDVATFYAGQSLQKPKEYEGPDGADATANAALSARLPYLFATSRFAHYLKMICRDKVGSLTSREAMEEWLTQWV